MTFTFHPVIIAALLVGIGALVAVFIVWRLSTWLGRVLMYGLAVTFAAPTACFVLAIHPEWVDGRFRTYKAFYADIRVGMTRDEVFRLLDRHYPNTGRRHRPKLWEDEPGSLGFFMDPEGAREPNCEGVFLALIEGRVTEKTYSPD